MVKFIKIVLTTIVFIFVVALIAFGLLVYFIDPNSLKPYLTQVVKSKTGYQLTIDGKLTWTVYPHLGIYIPQMQLAENKQVTPFVTMKAINLLVPVAGVLNFKENLAGKIQVDDIQLMNMHVRQLNATVAWFNNQLSLKPITANFYDGQMNGEASAKSLTSIPKWRWQVKLQNINIESLLGDLSKQNSKLKLLGLAQIEMVAASIGKSKNDIMQQLSGDIKLAINQGAIDGINLDYFVDTADAIINRRAIASPNNLNQTKFENLTASARIENGIAVTNDILLQSQTLETKGKGNINLVAETLNINLLTTPKEQIKTQYEIPINITGSLNNPNIDADMSAIEKKVAKEVIERLKNRVEDKISKFLGN